MYLKKFGPRSTLSHILKRHPHRIKKRVNKKSEDVNDVTADSGYETVASKDKIGSVGGCMKAAFAVYKFRKMKILEKHEKYWDGK